MTREKRIAAMSSFVLHVILFSVLAASGFFAYLQHKEAVPIDVTVYDGEALQEKTAGATSASNGSPAASSGTGETMEMPTVDTLPAISESYTQQVAVEREVKRIERENHVNHEEAEQMVSDKKGHNDGLKSVSDGNGKNSSGNSGRGDATANQGGEGPAGNQGSPLSEHGDVNRQEPQAAVCVFRPNPRDYQSAAQRNKNVGGSVAVGITISADGSVISSYIISGSGKAELDATALTVASRYRFKPALNGNGEPVNSSGQIDVTF
jgi:TonB family protein